MIKDLTVIPSRCGNCNEKITLHAKSLENNIEYLDGKNKNFQYELDTCQNCLYTSLDIEKSTNMKTKLKVKSKKYREIFDNEDLELGLRKIEAALFLTKDKDEEFLLNMYAAWRCENLKLDSISYRRKANMIFKEKYETTQVPLKNVLENIDSVRQAGEFEEALEKINKLKNDATKAGYHFPKQEVNFLHLEQLWCEKLDKTAHSKEEIK